MTPAEELAAAADKLDALASKATPNLGSFDDIEDVLFPEDLAYIAAMNPLVGNVLAEWLRSLAATLTGDPSDYCAGAGHGSYDGEEACDSWFCETITHALALARPIIGGES